MPGQVRVYDEIKLVGDSQHRGNISGIILPKLKIADFGFAGTSTLYGWSSTTGANGCTLAAAAADGGAITLTMGGTDEDCGEFFHTAQWSPAYNCGMFAKLKISAITDIAVTAGFVDAYENTNDHIAGEIDTASLRNMSNTADWCGFTFDTDQTTDVWYIGASNNGTEGTPVAAVGSLAPVANTYFYVMVQTNTAGDVKFYYGTNIDNLVNVGSLPAAIAYASTNLLAPYIGILSHSATADVCTISRVVVWQDN
jgi:hypothetical protein